MKKITRILVCLLLCAFSVCMFACDKRTDKEKNFTYPNSSDVVFGNGGMAVKKGNFLYFVNGYFSTDDMTDKKASYTRGSLMLMKLDNSGNIVLNDDDVLDDGYYITMSNKLVGFEATNLFIAGDYLYFTSPCLEDESGQISTDNSNWAKERVVFYRMKLNKTGNIEQLHKSNVANENVEFKYYLNGNDAYILIYEKGENIDNADVKDSLYVVGPSVDTLISSNVSSVVMSDDATKVYYALEDDTTGDFVINNLNVLSRNKTELKKVDENQLELKFVANGNLFFTVSHTISETYTDLKKINLTDKSISKVYDNIGNFSSYKLSVDSDAIVAVKNNTIRLIKTTGVNEYYQNKDAVDESLTDTDTIELIGFANGCIVYRNNTTIKTLDYSNFKFNGQVDIEEIANDDQIQTTYFDLDDNYLYFYKACGENKNAYLYRVKIVDSNKKLELVGILDATDIESEVDE